MSRFPGARAAGAALALLKSPRRSVIRLEMKVANSIGCGTNHSLYRLNNADHVVGPISIQV